jgi:hypothetical protein
MGINMELNIPDALPTSMSVDDMVKAFTLEVFEKEVRATKSGTAAGADGWSADAIKRICNSNKSCMRLFYYFFKAMIRT